MPATQRFLVKVSSQAKSSHLMIDGLSVTVRSRPLFNSIGHAPSGVKHGQGGLAVASPTTPTWHIVEPVFGIAGEMNPWDLCHEMVVQGMGVLGEGAVVFAE